LEKLHAKKYTFVLENMGSRLALLIDQLYLLMHVMSNLTSLIYLYAYLVVMIVMIWLVVIVGECELLQLRTL